MELSVEPVRLQKDNASVLIYVSKNSPHAMKNKNG
jgi:hypothetical protein